MELKNFFAQDSQGNIIPNPLVYVYHAGTQTLVSEIYTAEGVATNNPFVGGSNGLIQVSAPDGDYDLRVVGGGRESTLRFRFSAGKQGDPGIDYDVIITSSMGTVFRVGDGRTTTLYARVFKNGVEVTDDIPLSAFRWTRTSFYPREAPYDDETWNSLYRSGYKQITINVDDIRARATFVCDIVM